jgi:hypothetical protein
MHQPRPQKAVSLENIESPVQSLNSPQPYQQAFHQQVPVQVSNGLAQEGHHRNPSYPSQHSTGTPLSQIPERAIHAAPFQPNAYAQQGFYGQPYQMMQPQQGYYYPQPFGVGGNIAPPGPAATFLPLTQQSQGAVYGQPGQAEAVAAPPNGQAPPGSNLVAQEVNGMVYYYDASHLPTVAGLPSYQGAAGYVPGLVGLGGMMTPSPDGFYYQQQAPGVVFYGQ